jgi:hypothetical protein
MILLELHEIGGWNGDVRSTIEKEKEMRRGKEEKRS